MEHLFQDSPLSFTVIRYFEFVSAASQANSLRSAHRRPYETPQISNPAAQYLTERGPSPRSGAGWRTDSGKMPHMRLAGIAVAGCGRRRAQQTGEPPLRPSRRPNMAGKNL